MSPTLCDPIDCSQPGSPDHGIIQARQLEWGAISFSNAWKWKVKVKSLSRVRLLATPWTAAFQAPLPMGFSRQEYWSGVPLPSPGDLPHLVYWILGGVFKALCRQRPYSQTCDFSSSRVQMWELDHSLTDYSPPGFSVRGISQARILQLIAIPFSRGSSPPSDLTCVSCIGRLILYCWITREWPVFENVSWTPKGRR